MAKRKEPKMPKQSCPYGYSAKDLIDALGENIYRDELMPWMGGQTMMLCDGRSYNHELRIYEDNECAPNGHGGIVYAGDLYRFLAKLPVID